MVFVECSSRGIFGSYSNGSFVISIDVGRGDLFVVCKRYSRGGRGIFLGGRRVDRRGFWSGSWVVIRDCWRSNYFRNRGRFGERRVGGSFLCGGFKCSGVGRDRIGSCSCGIGYELSEVG